MLRDIRGVILNCSNTISNKIKNTLAFFEKKLKKFLKNFISLIYRRFVRIKKFNFVRVVR